MKCIPLNNDDQQLINSMENKVICINPKCKSQLKRPQTPFIKCPICKTDFFVFCHEFPFKLFEHIQCSKCTNELYYFFCFKCTGLMNFVKYRMGSISACKCGFKGCYVVCNNCKKPECFPPERRYEGIAWKCSYCQKPFNFMTCDQCFHQIYEQNFTTGQTMNCKNKNCRAYLHVKTCQSCKYIFMDSRGRNRCEPCYEQHLKNAPGGVQPEVPAAIKPTGQTTITTSQTPSSSKPISQDSLCKVCIDKPAQFIHTKCFHLCVCQLCVKSMKNICPLCRAQGEFRKVFK